jgi:aldehyde dehydrogenase (NAD+)
VVQAFRCYVDGRWVAASTSRSRSVIDPASERQIGKLCLAGPEDVHKAVGAARRAFVGYSRSTQDERLSLLGRILAEYEKRLNEVAAAATADMGAPAWLAEQAHAVAGLDHLNLTIETLERYRFAEEVEPVRIHRIPIGVCALMSSRHWPMAGMAASVARALAVGCSVVLKPPDTAPASGQLWAEIMHAAGVPNGVFNMIVGDATTEIGLSEHPEVDFVFFSGSRWAAAEIARTAAASGKRVRGELDGKSVNIVLDDAELGEAVPAAVEAACLNAGQSSDAPARLLIPQRMLDDAVTLARASAERIEVGAPASNAAMGPVASATEWRRIQDLISDAIAEGANAVAGGLGKPSGLPLGYYVRPTVLTGVTPEMALVREEMVGPVIALIGYGDEADAIRIANQCDHARIAYLQSTDRIRATRLAMRLHARRVIINQVTPELAVSGGLRRLGGGSRWRGEDEFSDYLDLRVISGCA